MRFHVHRSRRQPEVIRVPFPDMITPGFGVYYRAGRQGPAGADRLLRAVRDWMERHTQEPLSSAMQSYLDEGMLSIDDVLRGDLPDPPTDFLFVNGGFAAEASRYKRADRVIAISAGDLAGLPPFGLLTALGAARAIALELRGIILDTHAIQPLAISTYEADLTPDSAVDILENVSVLPVPDSFDSVTLQTYGMLKYGLPNVEVVEAPPDLLEELAPVLLSVAEVLLVLTLEQGSLSGKPLRELLLDPEIRIEGEQIAVLTGVEEEVEFDLYRARHATLRVSYMGKRKPLEERTIRIGPHRGFAGHHAEWLYALVGALFGAETSRDTTP